MPATPAQWSLCRPVKRPHSFTRRQLGGTSGQKPNDCGYIGASASEAVSLQLSSDTLTAKGEDLAINTKGHRTQGSQHKLYRDRIWLNLHYRLRPRRRRWYESKLRRDRPD